ncbi:MAG TPA: efflux RND transporter permease subunit, partial [Candidatus Manganitrophaceae bacterium]|nr:efflux RND transporter permease subunit [Candidatus Manganitrophaceae bacterium]
MTFAEKLVSFILRQRFIVIGAAVLLAVWGIWAFKRLPIEAYPDVAPLKVQIISQWPGRGSEEVERGITVPVESAIAGLPKMASVRSISLFGLSVVTVVFEDDADNYQSRQQILSRVNSLTLPAGVNPNLSPDSGATGELYRYTVEGEGIDVMELKTLQDWVLEREFKKVPGVVDVVSFGGPIKQYHIQVDPLRLKNYNITVQQLFNAVAGSNNNIGANTIDHGEESYVVRGIGLIRSVADLEDTVLASRGGTPVLVKDVATVSIGSPPRLGLVGKDKKGDVVEGIILARRGENALEVLGRVKEKVVELNQSILPTQVKVKPYYDRTDLIHMTTHTVFENLIVGIGLVVGILLLFLGNFRSAFIVTVTIPLSLLFAF